MLHLRRHIGSVIGVLALAALVVPPTVMARGISVRTQLIRSTSAPVGGSVTQQELPGCSNPSEPFAGASQGCENPLYERGRHREESVVRARRRLAARARRRPSTGPTTPSRRVEVAAHAKPRLSTGPSIRRPVRCPANLRWGRPRCTLSSGSPSAAPTSAPSPRTTRCSPRVPASWGTGGHSRIRCPCTSSGARPRSRRRTAARWCSSWGPISASTLRRVSSPRSRRPPAAPTP